MEPRTKIRDVITAGDLGTSAATRTATVTPPPPSDPASTRGGPPFETHTLGRPAEEGLSTRDDDIHPVRERASAPLSDTAAADGSSTKKGGAASGRGDDHLIEGVDPGRVDNGMHDDQRFDQAQAAEQAAHRPVAAGAADTPGNDSPKSDTPNFLQHFGGQGIYMDFGGEDFVSVHNNGNAIIDSGKTLHAIDIDFALYMPINIDIAVNSSSYDYTASMTGDELSQGKATNFSSLEQYNFSVSDDDAVSSSVANSGGNSLFGGLVAINAGNPAISIALAINDASINQSNSLEGSGGPNDNATVSSALEPLAEGVPMADKFGSLPTGNLNISEHDANSLSVANSGFNSVHGGLLALSVGNPAISQAVSIDVAPINQANLAPEFNSDLVTDFHD